MLCAPEAFKFEMIVDYLHHTLGQSFATIAKNIDVPGNKDESKERNLRRYRHGEVAIPGRIKNNTIEHYNLNHDVFKLGAITNQETDDPNCFGKMKKKYIKDRFSSGKLINIHNQVFINESGTSNFKIFCQSTGIPLGYFANISNGANIRYIIDIISHMDSFLGIDLDRLELMFYEASQSNQLVHETGNFPTKEMDQQTRIAVTPRSIEAIGQFENNNLHTVVDADPNNRWIDVRFELNEECHPVGLSNHHLFYETGRGYIPRCHSADLGLSMIQVMHINKMAGAFSARFRVLQGGSSCIVRLH